MKLKVPSPALVVATVALVVALAGSAWAAVNLPKNSVGSPQIKRGAVKAPDVKNRAITAKKVRNRAIAAGKLRNGAVTGPKLDEALLGAIENPSIRYEGSRRYSRELNGPGSCGAGNSGEYNASDVDRLIFYSYSAERSGGGSTEFRVNRSGANVTFSLAGTETRAGEGFFLLPAGDTARPGVNMQHDTCGIGDASITVDYFALELEEPDPGTGG